MKVLFNCHVPFGLAHGGAQVQIEETMRALTAACVEVEPLRWWDGAQAGDIFHHFGRIPANLAQLAKGKGMRVVMSDLMTEQGSRTGWRLAAHQAAHQTFQRIVPRRLLQAFNWDAYQIADATIVLTPWEAELEVRLHSAPPGRVHVVPNGVETIFFESQPAARGKWLICTATITARKRVLELAEAALAARTPLWVVGKPYDPEEACARRFMELARANPDGLRFEGPIHDRARLAAAYREARGFVLLSAMESLSLSALEAAACECPLLLSDLPWARTVFGESATYCPVTTSTAATAPVLRSFYDAAPGIKPPPKPVTWDEVARQIKTLYERLLSAGAS